jgi:shikimate kinase
MKSNIVMIGMPGGGKSTVGVVLAKMMGMDFLDCDLAIIKARGMKLQELIDKEGVEEFLKTEARVIQSLQCQNTVIATGGSAVLDENTVRHLKEIGNLVYLYHPYEEIQERIPNLENRGIAFENGQTLRTMYEYREPIYRRCADMIIDASVMSITDTAMAIIRQFCE